MFDFLEDAFKRPFSCCVAFTALLSVVPAGASFVLAGVHADNDCRNSLHVWLALAGVNFLVLLAMAVWMFHRFKKPYDRDDPKDRDIVARLCELLCHSKIVALYLLFLVWLFAWQVVGHRWVDDADPEEPLSCEDALKTGTDVMLAIVWVYLGVGGAFFMLDLTCKLCRYRLCPEQSRETDLCCCCKLCCGCCMPVQTRHSGGRQRRHHHQRQASAPGRPATHHMDDVVLPVAEPVQQPPPSAPAATHHTKHDVAQPSAPAVPSAPEWHASGSAPAAGQGAGAAAAAAAPAANENPSVSERAGQFAAGVVSGMKRLWQR